MKRTTIVSAVWLLASSVLAQESKIEVEKLADNVYLFTYRGWIAALEKLYDLDFEILAPGHGPAGNKPHVGEYITYMKTLTGAVQDGIDKGQTFAQMQETLELPQYKDWTRYDEHFGLNIEGVYRELTK